MNNVKQWKTSKHRTDYMYTTDMLIQWRYQYRHSSKSQHRKFDQRVLYYRKKKKKKKKKKIERFEKFWKTKILMMVKLFTLIDYYVIECQLIFNMRNFWLLAEL